MDSRLAYVSVAGLWLAACGASNESPNGDETASGSAPLTSATEPASRGAGAVFTMSDDASANNVLAFERGEDGTLSSAGSYPTGGKGSGGGEGVLGSQGSVSLSENGRFLLVVNAGSNDVTSFRVEGVRLVFAARAPSGGVLPVSVTEHHGVVYVVHSGDASVAGLLLDEDGALRPLPGSKRSLSDPTAKPADISFDREGDTLAVTEKGTNAITLFDVSRHGFLSGPHVNSSSGATPFGFAFAPHDLLLVSEAKGSAASSYRVERGLAKVVSASIPDTQKAACWLAVTGRGDYAFLANAGSGTLSSYHVEFGGALQLAFAEAGVVSGGKPLDIGLSRGDEYLYAIDANLHTIDGFRLNGGGALAPLGAVGTSLPSSAVGLAVR